MSFLYDKDQKTTKLVASGYLPGTPAEKPLCAKRRHFSPLSDDDGFTLIEVLVSVVILAVGIVGITALQVTSLSSEALTRSYDTCVNLASDALDRIAANQSNVGSYFPSGPFVVKGDGSSTTPSDDPALTDHDDLFEAMTRAGFVNGTLTVTIAPSTPIPGVSTITSTITWPQRGDTKRCSAQSIV